MFEKDTVYITPFPLLYFKILSVLSVYKFCVLILQELWRRRVENYWDLLSPKISANTIRNVMDMKANLGSFGAALKSKDVWVMNVAPVNASSRLKIIYDRGLIGTIHDWCAFSVCLFTHTLTHICNWLF